MPAHWTVARLKECAQVTVSNVDKHTFDGEVPVKLCNYTDVYKNDRITADMPFMDGTATPVEIGKFRLEIGDVVVTKDSEDWRDIAVPALVVSTRPDLVCGYHLAIMRANRSRLDGAYLNWAVNSRALRFELEGLAANGVTRFGLTRADLAGARIPLPPLPEQRAIAAFLDRATAKIDALIKKKRRFIELLEEKRLALITQAVTRGLDLTVTTKDTRVEWLGSIPAHWRLGRIASFCAKLTNGYVGPTRDILVEEGIRYLQSLHVKSGRIVFAKEYYVEREWSRLHPRSILGEGDVVIVQTGDIGQVAAIPRDYVGSNCHALIIARFRDGMNVGEYLSLLLRSTYGQAALKAAQTGALHPHLECSKVREISICLPPPEEQRKIVDYVRSQLNRLDGLTKSVKLAIETLSDYRSALITAAVTGKIDVREASAMG